MRIYPDSRSEPFFHYLATLEQVIFTTLVRSPRPPRDTSHSNSALGLPQRWLLTMGRRTVRRMTLDPVIRACGNVVGQQQEW
jgi:hypothetical protein